MTANRQTANIRFKLKNSGLQAQPTTFRPRAHVFCVSIIITIIVIIIIIVILGSVVLARPVDSKHAQQDLITTQK